MHDDKPIKAKETENGAISTLPAIAITHGEIWISHQSGASVRIDRAEAIARTNKSPHIALNAPMLGKYLNFPEFSCLDILELFAFVYPARFLVPTVSAVAKALDLGSPEDAAHAPSIIRKAALKTLYHMRSPDWKQRRGAWASIQSLSRARWVWAGHVLSQLEKPKYSEGSLFTSLPIWEEEAPPPRPQNVDLCHRDISARLHAIVGEKAEERVAQKAYAQKAAYIFNASNDAPSPSLLLAQAGTGTGKTYGYLAPASLWSEQAGGPVWISTYTKTLQRQLSAALKRFEEEPSLPKPKIVIRKGRENYLCLLNLDDAIHGGFLGRSAIFAHLVARWAAYTENGDMVSGDLPGWLPPLFRRIGANALTDRRGECVFAGCPHFQRCFIERSARASAKANIVVANHALVMINAARGNENYGAPQRIIFDEGHHLFHAADASFAIHLSGQECLELRRWIMGPENKQAGRRRGLAARLTDLASYDPQSAQAIEDAIHAASLLPVTGWMTTLHGQTGDGIFMDLLRMIHLLVHNEDKGADQHGYGLEANLPTGHPPLYALSAKAAQAFDDILRPLRLLIARIEAHLVEPPDWLDNYARMRLEGARHGLFWRIDLIKAWVALLNDILSGDGSNILSSDDNGSDEDNNGRDNKKDSTADNNDMADAFIDWLFVTRIEGRETNIGIARHFRDPMRPFAETSLHNIRGAMATSATLINPEDTSDIALRRTGFNQFQHKPMLENFDSMFDFPKQSKILIVTDIKRGDMPALSGAFARLIIAANGGAIGLFTAIKRLKAAHRLIFNQLSRHHLPLYAQHVDPMDTGTLVDIFRDDPRASLLGTDALRDGVDVPGDSLRLVIMDQLPWPRPDILHKARRELYGGRQYDDFLLRARLAQGYGRLIRKANDRGIFIMLSPAFPSRLFTAFPPGVSIERVTIADALEIVPHFIKQN